jgi:ATP-dependent DNA ligase
VQGIGKWVKLYSRSGNDLTWRFPLIVELRPVALAVLIDGELPSIRPRGRAIKIESASVPVQFAAMRSHSREDVMAIAKHLFEGSIVCPY